MKMTKNTWFLPSLLAFIVTLLTAFVLKANFYEYALINLVTVAGSFLVMLIVVFCGSNVKE